MAFGAFMESLYLQGLDLTREPDYGGDVELWFLDHQSEQHADDQRLGRDTGPKK